MKADRKTSRAGGRRWLEVTVGLIPLALLLGAWQILGKDRDPRFPRPSTWMPAVAELHERGVLMGAIWTTTQGFLISLAFSFVLGAALGVLIGMSPATDRALGPLLEILRVTPPAAIVPIAVLLIGSTTATTIAVVIFAAIWPIMLNTASAVQTMPQLQLDVAKSLGLTRSATVAKVVIPSLVPGIALGVRIAAPICLVVVLVAEMLASTGGIGQLLIERQHSFDAPAVFGLLVLVAALGLVVNVIVNLIERELTRSFR